MTEHGVLDEITRLTTVSRKWSTQLTTPTRTAHADPDHSFLTTIKPAPLEAIVSAVELLRSPSPRPFPANNVASFWE